MKTMPPLGARLASLTFRRLLFAAGTLIISFGLVRGVAAAQGAPPQTLLTTADSVFQEMSHLTGLGIKSPLKKRIVSREEMRKLLEETLRIEYAPQKMREQETVLKAFGLVSPEFDLAKFFISFYTEQAAGLYDPRSKTMFIADWVMPDMQQMVLAHELTHALQDQNFDLERFVHADISNDDATAARQAVTEGYATAAMFQHLLPPMNLGALSSLGSLLDLSSMPSLGPMMDAAAQQQFSQFPAFANAPFFLRFQALFPYSQGMSFMQKGLAQGGWAKLNQIFTNPPETTREIFSPQFYFNGTANGKQESTQISLRRPKPFSSTTGLHFVTENDMGELGYYSIIGQFISEEEAKSVATLLTGDHYLVYENPDAHRYALVAVTRWESAEAALAFFRDYRTILTKKFLELTPDRRSTPDLFIGSTASGNVLLLRKGGECAWAEGVPEAQTDSMIDYLRSIQ